MTPQTLKQIRTERFQLSREKFGALIGYTGRAIYKMETGKAVRGIPKWMPYTLAWILEHGETHPFE